MLEEELQKIKEQLGFAKEPTSKTPRKEKSKTKSVNTKRKAKSSKKTAKGQSAYQKAVKERKRREQAVKGKPQSKRSNNKKKDTNSYPLIQDYVKAKATSAPSKNVVKHKYVFSPSINKSVRRSNLWIGPEAALDRFTLDKFIKDESNSTESQELVIGLDFGTAFTKVVVADHIYALPVKFNRNYLLPSEVHLNSKGVFTLDAKESENRYGDLKLPLLFGSIQEDDKVLIIAFIALVFKEIRAWVKKSQFQNKNIEWLVNAGLPTDSYHNELLNKSYKEVISSAWNLSYLNELTPEIAKYYYNNSNFFSDGLISKDIALPDDCINLFPEYVAQIAGYVNSPSRRNFSHLLIDIGAGTLDMVMFIMKEREGEWIYHTTAKSISNLGADVLLKHRSHCAGTQIKNNGALISKNSDFARFLGVSQDELKEIDKPFSAEVKRELNVMISKVAAGYKFGVDITTFKCGGGREIEFYAGQLSALKTYPINVIDISVPNKFFPQKDFPSNQYHRFSVAMGLSYDPYNIGSPEVKDVDSKVVTKEWEPSSYLLCPK